jgi:hypothetical protein
MRPRIAFGELRLSRRKSLVIGDSTCARVGNTRRHTISRLGTYIITAATLHRKPLFDSDTKLDLSAIPLSNSLEITRSFCRHGLFAPIIIIWWPASNTPRQHTAISFDICTVN